MTNIIDRLTAALAGQYQLERELGQGGMATVYLALDRKHHRQVAIKVLRPELAAALGPERFTREIEVAARLQHPHILGVLDSGNADGFFYYVMPFVEGETLRDRLARTGELPVPEAVRLLGEIAEALSVAHRAGVVHRDIKPENVLLSGRHALVMDFGVAKAVTEASGRQQLTTAGVALGTPAYMAPEQASADPQMDGRVDIYALGVVGYEMLTGHTPFPGLNPQQTLAAHMTQAPPPLSQQRAGLSPALDAVLMRCLAKRPADRFQTADDVLAALEPLATPSGGVTPTHTRPEPAWEVVSTMRGWIPLTIAAAALAIATLSWVMLRGRHRTAPSQIRPERVQLTFTGNASSPGVSQDGRRIAYATRQCDAEGRCTQDVVIQDIGGAGSATVARGALQLGQISWSTDERFLLLDATFGSRNGVFSVSTLGGPPRFLGCCDAQIADGDTVLLSTAPKIGDSVGWVRWVTMDDGLAHDSVTIHARSEDYLAAIESSTGQRIVIVRYAPDRTVVTLLTRHGLPIDSVVFPSPQIVRGAVPISENGEDRFLMAALTRLGAPDVIDVIRYRLDRQGHIAAAADTLVRQLSVNAGGDLSRSGILAYAYGPTDYSVWAMRRENPGSMHFAQRRLIASTGFILAALSPNGNRLLLARPITETDGRFQLSMMPFDSGAETPLGAPLFLEAWDWSRDGESVVIAARQGKDSIALARVGVPSGESHPLATLARGDFVDVGSIAGGGLIVVMPGQRFRRLGIPGLPDSTFRLPEAVGLLELGTIDPSPDGRAFVASNWNEAHDSLLVYRVSVVDGRVSLLAGFVAVDADYGRQPRWLEDGSIVVPIPESEYSMAWLRLPAKGGPSIRLGSPPRYPAFYWLSGDGRRVLVEAADKRPDIFLIPNFGKMLKQE